MATQRSGLKPSDRISPISSRHRTWNWPSSVCSSAGAATSSSRIRAGPAGPAARAGAQSRVHPQAPQYVTAIAAAQVHLHALAVASFGIGVICWVMLGSVIMNRLFTRPALPNALVPTLPIELGIPAVAGLAYFAVAGRTVSFVACALGGYAVLMALVQVRLIPVYHRLSFTPGAWSFTFAYAAAAADALTWLAIKKPPASTGYAIAVIALLTAFVSWIAFRTVVLAVRGQLFPAR